jgi:hypothetical protein
MFILNFDVLHSEGVGFDLKLPFDHHPFIIVKKAIDTKLEDYNIGSPQQPKFVKLSILLSTEERA